MSFPPAYAPVYPAPQPYYRPAAQPFPPSTPPAQPWRSAPVTRGAMPEERPPALPPARLVMPSPAQLGIGEPVTPAARPIVGLDWGATRQRLQELGCVGFTCERLRGGDYRFVCQVPMAGSPRPRTVVAQAASEAEAVRQALSQTEALVRGREGG